MKIKMQVAAVLAAIALGGCAMGSSNQGGQGKSFDVVHGDYTKAETRSLCVVYGLRMNGALEARAELARRGVFTPQEWQLVDAGKAAVGMNECAVSATIREDALAIQKTSMDTKGNLVSQARYFNCAKAALPYCPYTRIDIQNGRIASITAAQTLD
jgi:hypothetical protein